jgi:hypothetical protein
MSKDRIGTSDFFISISGLMMLKLSGVLKSQHINLMIYWPGTEKSGMFTVRSAYKLAIQLDFNHNGCPANSEMPTGARPIWKSIWKLSVPQKVKLFIWNVAA